MYTAQPIEKSIVIHAPTSAVWEALTTPDLMRQWMAEPEVALHVQTDWSIGGPIIVSGSLHGSFVNKGKVLQFEPMKALSYSHQSSHSRLPEEPESYSIFSFQLEAEGEQTSLTITVSGFPTEVIYKHLAFYWRVIPGILKRFIEERRC